jgi:hypothetical protein
MKVTHVSTATWPCTDNKLDAQVARALAWQPIPFVPFGQRPLWCLPGALVDASTAMPLPPFSTKLWAAQDVLEHVRRNGGWVNMMSRDGMGGGDWIVDVAIAPRRPTGRPDMAHRRVGPLPRAICEAFLAARQER